MQQTLIRLSSARINMILCFRIQGQQNPGPRSLPGNATKRANALNPSATVLHRQILETIFRELMKLCPKQFPNGDLLIIFLYLLAFSLLICPSYKNYPWFYRLQVQLLLLSPRTCSLTEEPILFCRCGL